MNINNKKELPARLQTISAKPNVIITPKVHALMSVLHSLVGKVEWSGILFYTVEGSITDINNMVFTLQHIMLKDIGTSGHTSYEFGEDVIDFFDANPECENMKMGMLHTHHNMNCYFSAADLSELQDNAKNHNYYLSFITNFACEYVAKLAIQTLRVNNTHTIKGDDGNDIEIEIPSNQPPILVADCTVQLDLDEYNLKSYNHLKNRKVVQTFKPITPWVNPMYKNNFKTDEIARHPLFYSFLKSLLDDTLTPEQAKSLTLVDVIKTFSKKYKTKAEVDAFVDDFDEILDVLYFNMFGEYPDNEEYIELLNAMIDTFSVPLFLKKKATKWLIDAVKEYKAYFISLFDKIDVTRDAAIMGTSISDVDLNKQLEQELMAF